MRVVDGDALADEGERLLVTRHPVGDPSLDLGGVCDDEDVAVLWDNLGPKIDKILDAWGEGSRVGFAVGGDLFELLFAMHHREVAP